MYVWAFHFAMKKAKRYRFALLLAGFWPLTIFMCGSFSYDAIYLSSFLVFLGLSLSDMDGKYDFWICVISFGLMISIKPTSVVLIVLIFLMPKERTSAKSSTSKKEEPDTPVILSLPFLPHSEVLRLRLIARTALPGPLPLRSSRP
jgi:uncharacterized membrane protein